MIRNLLYKKIIVAVCLLMAFGSFILISSFSLKEPAANTGTLKISFINAVNGKPVVLRDSLYSNYFNEQYSISKLKYYISNIVLKVEGKETNLGGYYLINAAAEENGFELTLPAGSYSNIQFLLGVDSIRNCSGAQTDALDPMNDMFWTWNSGYVMIKLEGTSPKSNVINNKVEYHIGGFSGPNSVLNYLTLPFSKDKSLLIRKGKTSTVIIDVDVDGFWNAGTAIRISGTPVCSLPGVLAKQIAANFSKLFRVKDIINEK